VPFGVEPLCNRCKAESLATARLAAPLVNQRHHEKDRAIRRKQEQSLVTDLDKLAQRVENGGLVKEEKIGGAAAWPATSPCRSLTLCRIAPCS
jgi:hypothetical protein